MITPTVVRVVNHAETLPDMPFVACAPSVRRKCADVVPWTSQSIRRSLISRIQCLSPGCHDYAASLSKLPRGSPPTRPLNPEGGPAPFGAMTFPEKIIGHPVAPSKGVTACVRPGSALIPHAVPRGGEDMNASTIVRTGRCRRIHHHHSTDPAPDVTSRSTVSPGHLKSQAKSASSHSLTVAHVMTRDVISVSTATSVSEIACILIGMKISAVPVVEHGGTADRIRERGRPDPQGRDRNPAQEAWWRRRSSSMARPTQATTFGAWPAGAARHDIRCHHGHREHDAPERCQHDGEAATQAPSRRARAHSRRHRQPQRSRQGPGKPPRSPARRSLRSTTPILRDLTARVKNALTPCSSAPQHIGASGTWTLQVLVGSAAEREVILVAAWNTPWCFQPVQNRMICGLGTGFPDQEDDPDGRAIGCGLTHARRNRLSMIGFLPRPTEVQGRVLRVLFPPQGGAFWLGLASKERTPRRRFTNLAAKRRSLPAPASGESQRARAAEGATAPETLRHRGPLVVRTL